MDLHKLASAVLTLPADQRGELYKLIEAAETAMHPPKRGASERLAKGLNLPRLLGKASIISSDADVLEHLQSTGSITYKRDGSVDQPRTVLAACIHPSQRRQGHPGGATLT